MKRTLHKFTTLFLALVVAVTFIPPGGIAASAVFTNPSGTIAIEVLVPPILEFDSARGFSEGLAAVRKDGKSGFIDKTGEIVIPLEFDSTIGFSEGLAAVRKDGKWGFIDQTGEIVIPLEFDDTWGFSEGLAPVEKDGKWGYIDKTGEIVISFEYDFAGNFRGGLAAVRKDDKWGFIDQTGEIVIPIELDGASGFSEGLTGAAKDGQWGFIDKTGEVVIPFEFDYVEGFSEGLAGVKKDGKWGYINKTGEVVIPFAFSYGLVFSDGLAGVRHYDDWSSWAIIDKTGEVVIPFSASKLFAHRMTPEIVGRGGIFSEGLALFFTGSKWGILQIVQPTHPPCPTPTPAPTSDFIATGSADGFAIDLTQENLTLLSDYVPVAFSLDGGTRWRAGAPDISRLLNRGMTLHLSDKPIDRRTRRPAEGASVITFPPINPRPAAPRVSVNYALGADVTGATTGAWMLTERGGTAAIQAIDGRPLEVRTVDSSGFNRLSASGVAIAGLTGTRVTRTRYIVRTAPVESNGTFTPASRTRRISVVGQQRAPRLRIRANGTINFRANTYINGVRQNNGLRGNAAVQPGDRVRIGATARRPATAEQVLVAR